MAAMVRWRPSFGPKALMRELKLHEPQRERPIVVVIRGGTYFLDRPLLFEADDSGTERAPISYRAYPGERPVFSGGTRIGGWKITGKGRWQATLPEVKAGKWSFAQLFVDEQRCFRPRLPKRGYYTIAARLLHSAKPETQGRRPVRVSRQRHSLRLGQSSRYRSDAAVDLVRSPPADCRDRRRPACGTFLRRDTHARRVGRARKGAIAIWLTMSEKR